MTGIYGGDGDQLSLEATFPQLRALERENGSLLRGLAARPATDRPAFVSLRSGMGSLVAALAAGYERTELLLGRAVARIGRGAAYEVELEGETLEADGVVVATPAFVTAALLADLDADLASAHAAVPYASSVVVTLAFSRADVLPLDGYGYLVPRLEPGDVLACTWSSQKWEARAPEGSVLVRVYAGRFGGRDLTRAADAELVALARAEVRRVGVAAEPTLTRVHRWGQGMPQYILGHPDRLAEIDEAIRAHPGLALAGAAYRGVGLPDCIASGERAAESVARALAAVST
jgi:oxygen-dependent protoporphyrinogen oxidase